MERSFSLQAINYHKNNQARQILPIFAIINQQGDRPIVYRTTSLQFATSL